MLDDFMLRATLAAIGTAISAGALGCFVVWRRMAYFGDATAHAAILGVALALLFGTSIFLGVGFIAFLMSVLIFALSGKGQSVDTILGVLSHGALALGLVAVTMIPNQRINLDAYLFGDVLTVTRGDLGIIWIGAVVVALVLWRHWTALLTSTLSPDLAYAAGMNPRREQLVLTLLLAAVVAVAIKVVGALLITAMLIIPAAAARNFAKTPEHMAFMASGIAALAAFGGVRLSVLLDTPVGPTIICVATVFFALGAVSSLVRRAA
jgi:zinc transport system permease protein